MRNFTNLLIFLSLVETVFAIQLKDGGYEDVYIYVQETNEENEFLLKRIQEVFTEASQLMFTATQQKMYFKKIKIVIPTSWSFKPEYKRIPVPSPFKEYIVVNRNTVRTPHVMRSRECGKEGMYMYLSAEHFLLKQGATDWGLHDHVIVHEWGHLRWGLFDEYPAKGPEFYQADGQWKPVSCHENIKGQARIGECSKAREHCYTEDSTKMLDARCIFCPDHTQILNVSLMSHQYLKDKLTDLHKTGAYVIQEVIPEKSWLGIVTFNDLARTVQGLTQINSQSDRHKLKSVLPTLATGKTCIGCGIEEAIRILKLKLGDAANTEIVVISDGENNVGNLQSSIQMAVNEKVIVHTIAVTQMADRLLANIAQKTGGKNYAYLQTSGISFAASFSETITGDLTSAKSQHVMLLSERIYSNESNLVQFNFTIDGGVGVDTSVTVITEIDQNINIHLVGPSNYSQNVDTHGSVATLLVPDVAMVGHYEVNITVQKNTQTIEYHVKSIPTKEDTVRMKSWLSTTNITSQTDDLPVAYVDVRKGFSPVVNADVEVHVENEEKSCNLALFDNGIDPDLIVNDGLYARYIMPECLGRGRVSVKGYVKGQAGKTSSVNKVFGAPEIMNDGSYDEPPEVFHESFQRIQLFEELYISSSYINEFTDNISPGRITDVNIYNVESKMTRFGESRNFTITWTAPGDDKDIGQASSYIFRISDDIEILLHDFDSAYLLEMNNESFIPQNAGMTEALKIIVDAEQTFTKNTYFAIKAVDEAGNLGKVSNILPIMVADGYRATAEKGSLDRGESTEVVDKDGIELGLILGAVFGLIVLVLISMVVVCIIRKRQIKGNNDVQMGKV